ncbi:MAG: hypothetical protein QNL04_15575, partial [SAR324 cluster bacterium]|nr:hypothetical protein [SAR324 cluster bacterium]
GFFDKFFGFENYKVELSNIEGNSNDVAEEVRELIAQEYKAGKILYIDSWMYSETEAKIAANRFKKSSC